MMIEAQPSDTCADTTVSTIPIEDDPPPTTPVVDPSDIQLDTTLLEVAAGAEQPSGASAGWLSAAEFAESFVRQEIEAVLQLQLPQPPPPRSSPPPAEVSSETSSALERGSSAAAELPQDLQQSPVAEETQPTMRGNSSSTTEAALSASTAIITDTITTDTTTTSASAVSGDVQELAGKLSQISIASAAPPVEEERPSHAALPPIAPNISQLLSGKPSKLQPLPQDLLEQNAFLLGMIQDANGESNLGIVKSQFKPIMEACGLPIFLMSSTWKYFTEDWVVDGIPGRDPRPVRTKRLTFERFQTKWNGLIERFQDNEVALIYELLKGSRPGLSALSGESFEPVAEDVITQHRELEFLNGNAVFQRRYIETVITRIFYTVARTLPPLESDVLSGAAKGISFQEFKRSNLLDVLKHLSEMEINEERNYFSYKHFFVVYCKFYDLEAFSNLCIHGQQLLKYDNGSLNQLICERIANGCGLPYQWRSFEKGIYKLRTYHYGASFALHGDSGMDLGANDDEHASRVVGQLNYVEFLWFIFSEEDRSSMTAIEYWFRIVDLDDDGLVSLYELEQLWEYQESKFFQEGCTAFDFRDIICVALDITKTQPAPQLFAPFRSFPHPATGSLETVDKELNPLFGLTSPITIHTSDLRKCPQLTARFFDYFINIQKMLERENTNGNRLHREIDEAQQMYFQQQQFMCAQASAKNEIPSDNRSPFARWADTEYDRYIMQEELEQHRQRLQEQQASFHQHAVDLYASAHDETGRSPEALREAKRVVSKWRRNRIRLRRSWLTRNADGSSKRRRATKPDDGGPGSSGGSLGEDEEFEDDDDDDVDNMDFLDEGIEEEDSLSDDEEFDDLSNYSDEEEARSNGEDAAAVKTAEEDVPKTKLCWADLAVDAPLSPPQSSKMIIQPVQPLGTLTNEYPTHVSRLQSSPPKSPPVSFGNRVFTDKSVAPGLVVEDLDDID